MLRRLLPKETSFFEFFVNHSKVSIEAAKELNAIATNPSELEMRVKKINDLEHEADEIARGCIEALHSTFITPFDRADIHRLIRRLDDVTDSIDSAASRMLLYEMRDARPELKQFTLALIHATTHIETAVSKLPQLHKDAGEIQKACLRVYEAESEADDILRTALVRLFKEEKDALQVIKWKEVFERLERATDRCQEVANIVSGVVIEAS
jgi:uncharacterized protein